MTPDFQPRLAGVLYLVIAICGGFSIGYVPAMLSAPGDAQATLHNLVTHKALYDAGLWGDIVVMLVEIVVTVLLYRMFRAVGPTLSMIAALARLVMAVIMAVMLFFDALVRSLIDGAGYLSVFSQDQLAALVLLFRDAQGFGVVIWQFFFALHLCGLGVLVVRAAGTPRVLGWILMIGAFGYLLDSIAVIVSVEGGILILARNLLLGIVTLAELSFALWLAIRNPQPDRFRPRAPEGTV